MLKTFNELGDTEKEHLLDFMKQKHNWKTILDVDRYIKAEIFGGGDFFFTLWQGKKIMGTLGAIVCEAHRGEVFLVDLHLVEERLAPLKQLFYAVKKKLTDFGELSIKIGIAFPHTYPDSLFFDIGFVKTYQFLQMNLVSVRHTTNFVSPTNYTFSDVTLENQSCFCQTHNDAFKNTANSCTLNVKDVEDMITNKEKAGICYLSGKAVGMYHLKKDEGTGWIDSIGVTPTFQKQGVGSVLLGYVLNHFSLLCVEQVKLVVVDTNHHAIKLYQKFGFQVEKVYSQWFEYSGV
ncbi:GNAT family N-acetyltransferase [Candidatus Uabimicrobium amorphum]|uniref:N-acetyltransferase n=1 Tax=Uabimicrobium amorphum TaxID=2596890 RepID=A0A5S9IK54_UABAM|nr:GNAT family N-acetyltransferase [Candidatus Uabimicrobium amorphum]BBM83369.1 N-acetyltransferase [Candidatus Uabimicrobium amorphum]